MSPKARDFVIIAFVMALIFWGSGMMFAFLIGLFNPNVDNADIFKILGPIAQNVSSAAISIVSAMIGVKVGESRERRRNQTRKRKKP